MKSFLTLLRSLFQQSEETKLRKQVLSENIDFDNIIQSSLKAKQLYDELKVKVHPDRFQDPELILRATALFQLIHQSKGDYNKLLSLKERAYLELPIGKTETIN